LEQELLRLREVLGSSDLVLLAQVADLDLLMKLGLALQVY
jgi:hypothetical protein